MDPNNKLWTRDNESTQDNASSGKKRKRKALDPLSQVNPARGVSALSLSACADTDRTRHMPSSSRVFAVVNASTCRRSQASCGAAFRSQSLQVRYTLTRLLALLFLQVHAEPAAWSAPVRLDLVA